MHVAFGRRLQETHARPCAVSMQCRSLRRYNMKRVSLRTAMLAKTGAPVTLSRLRWLTSGAIETIRKAKTASIIGHVVPNAMNVVFSNTNIYIDRPFCTRAGKERHSHNQIPDTLRNRNSTQRSLSRYITSRPDPNHESEVNTGKTKP